MMAARPVRSRLVVRAGEDAPASLVGGKAFRLRELDRRGLPVPPWIVLTTAATARMLAPVRRDVVRLAACVDAGDLAGAVALAGTLTRFVRRAEWPAAVRNALSEALGTLRTADGLAVRSSAAGEDGLTDSYAGVFESRLAVPSHRVDAAIRDCLAAVFAERVVRYRRARGLRGAWPRCALVIQEMAAARAAGVAFTADPRTGETRQIVTAGYGLGTGVVGDQVATDCYERAGDDAHWTRTVRSKDQAMVPDGAGGTVLRQVSPLERDRPALSDDELDHLARLLARVDLALGGAQDVEWCVDADGAFLLLQARPIGGAVGELAIWDDSNIGESYPGVTLPLTYSLVRRTYERLFTQALAQIGVPAPALAALGPSLRHLIGIVRGHLYMNLLGYYRLFAAAPGLGWTVAKWEEALGIRDAPDPAARPRGTGSAPRRAAGALRVWTRLLRRLLGIEAEVSRFEEGVDGMLAEFAEQDLTRWPSGRLLQAYEALARERLDAWTILIFNDLFAFLFTDQLARLCRDGPGSGRGDLSHRLLAGLGGVASIRPLRALRELASVARREPPVRELVWSALPPEDVWQRLGTVATAAPFLRRAAEYRARYGDRSVEELKLDTVTLAEAPWRLVDLLRSMGDGAMPDDAGVDDGRVRRAAEEEYRRRWAGRPLHGWAAMWVLRRARRLVAARENMSFARARAYGLVRRLVRAMGVALAREGVLEAPEDVHFATFDDLEAHARGGLPGASLGALVTARREAYRGYGGDPHPHRIVCRGSVYRAPVTARPPADAGTAGLLRGIPCSPGRARGPARVIRNGASAEDVRGRIIVARVTEPGWVFLLSAARGVVVERGSVLSHAAIIGRELGVPTVVGVTGAMAVIQDGDEVALDGSTGDVRVLGRAGTCPG